MGHQIEESVPKLRPPAMPIIYGLIERITYHNEENDFVVAKLQEKGRRILTTIVGNLAGINTGGSLKLSRRWVHSKKFGDQFQVENYEITVPATLHGIRKYLGSGLIKGIGSIMSERIVDKFGLDTLEIIEKKPEKLSAEKEVFLEEIHNVEDHKAIYLAPFYSAQVGVAQ